MAEAMVNLYFYIPGDGSGVFTKICWRDLGLSMTESFVTLMHVLAACFTSFFALQGDPCRRNRL